MARRRLVTIALILVAGAVVLAEVAAAAGPGYCSCLQGFKEPQCSQSLQALCQKQQEPICDDLGRFVNGSDVAAGQRVANRLRDSCGWQVAAERTTPCDCLQDLRAPACIAAAYVQCLAGSWLCPAMVLGRQAESFSRRAYASYLNTHCSDRFSTQQLAMNFTGVTPEQYKSDVQNGTLTALSNITGVPLIFINSSVTDLAAVQGNSSNLGRKLLQATPEPATSVAYLIRAPAAEGPAVQARLEDAMKDDAAGLYSAMEAAGVTARPSVSLNGAAPVGGPNTAASPAPAAAAPVPPPAGSPSQPAAPPVGLIVGAVLGSVLGGAALAWCVFAGLKAKKHSQQPGPKGPSPSAATADPGAAGLATTTAAAHGDRKSAAKDSSRGVTGDTAAVRDVAKHPLLQPQQQQTQHLQGGLQQEGEAAGASHLTSSSNSGAPARLDRAFAAPVDVLPVRGMAQPSSAHMMSDAPVAEPPNPATSASTAALTTQHLRMLPGSGLPLGPDDNSSELVTHLNADSLSGFALGSPLDVPGEDISQPTSSILVFPDKPGRPRHGTSEQSSMQLQQQGSSSLQAGQGPRGRSISLDQSHSSAFATTEHLM